MAVLQLVRAEWYAGRWQRALEHAALARELGEQTQDPQFRGQTTHVIALLESDLGRIDDARTHARDALGLAEAIGDEQTLIETLTALGRLELSLGNLRAAEEHLRQLPDRLLRTGHRMPGIRTVGRRHRGARRPG